jgi:hypothetical protein
MPALSRREPVLLALTAVAARLVRLVLDLGPRQLGGHGLRPGDRGPDRLASLEVWSTGYHYSITIDPLLAMGAADGLRNLLRLGDRVPDPVQGRGWWAPPSPDPRDLKIELQRGRSEYDTVMEEAGFVVLRRRRG